VFLPCVGELVVRQFGANHADMAKADPENPKGEGGRQVCWESCT